MKQLGPESPVAYFCAEYGIHESLRIYSGGLGILAGDHLKSASDLGIPLVAIGLFYRGGFFIQTIGDAGEQEVVELENDPATLPLERVLDPRGEVLEVVLPLPDREITITAWLLRVGGVRLYLLDTDCEQNPADDRAITRRLYSAGAELRILQEMVLGIGGELLLHALHIQPRVFHLNEGHAAFVVLARTARLWAADLDFASARDHIAATTVFTTHTPVPAGHDRFELELLERHFAHAPTWLGIEFEQLAALGQAEAEPLFNMTYLALRFAGFVNGVSRLHASVSRELLEPAFEGRELDEVPITGITNGVHLPSWTSRAVVDLLGVGEHERVQGHHFQRIDAVPSEALWHMRNHGRAQLVASLRERGLPADDPDALWIGFARRFASYKRAGLIFHDLDRLAELVGDRRRPLRVVFAGKAHPADEAGQQLIREVLEVCRDPRFFGRVLFVPNYEIDVARLLLEGVDVWLNNPIHGKEASGTSGMKAAANGAINLSIADGWWLEGADGHNGWTLGGKREFAEQSEQDQADAIALYELLEREVLPAFFERDDAGIPSAWIARMRASMRTIPVVFDSDRMVREYLTHAYEALGA